MIKVNTNFGEQVDVNGTVWQEVESMIKLASKYPEVEEILLVGSAITDMHPIGSVVDAAVVCRGKAGLRALSFEFIHACNELNISVNIVDNRNRVIGGLTVYKKVNN